MTEKKRKKQSGGDSGGVSLNSQGSIDVTGSVLAGRDANNARIQGVSSGGQADLQALFKALYKKIDESDTDADKDLVKQAVKKVEQEAAQPPEKMDQTKIEKTLVTLQKMAPDIFEVALTTFANPPAGVALVIKKIMDKVKAQTALKPV